MGKGTITDEAGEGAYTISLDYGTTILDNLIASLQFRIAELQTSIDSLEDQFNDLSAAQIAANNALNTAIANYNAAKTSTKSQTLDVLKQASVNATVAKYTALDAKAQVDYWELEKKQLEARLATLQATDLIDSKDVWCVDYTLDATGDVATLEINAEQPQILIAPGAEDYTTEYGNFLSREAMTPEAVYYNAALLPGWQKYKPTYRVGQITAIDRPANTCTVELDVAQSSAQDLSINQSGILTEVPIEYMECNSAAFAVYDRVVVKFESQDWEQPKVIGFESTSVPCGEMILRFNRYATGFGKYFVVKEAVHNGGIETPGDRVFQKMAAVLSGSAPYIPHPSLKVQYRESDLLSWEDLYLSGYRNAPTTFGYVFQRNPSDVLYFSYANWSEGLFRGAFNGPSEIEGVQLEGDVLYWWNGATPPADPPCYHHEVTIRFFENISTIQEYRILVDGEEELRVAYRWDNNTMFGVNLSDQLLDLSYGSIINSQDETTVIQGYSWKP